MRKRRSLLKSQMFRKRRTFRMLRRSAIKFPTRKGNFISKTTKTGEL